MAPLTRMQLGPCRRLGCSACCQKTEMTLLEEDIRRIDALGHRDYCVEVEGYLQLVNTLAGWCVFFDGQGCAIQEDKPIGCAYYPLVLDLRLDQAAFHDEFCPHTAQFEVTEADREAVRQNVHRQERERRVRLWLQQGRAEDDE